MRDLGSDPGQSVTHLVACCIEAVESEGVDAVEAFCRAYPEQADKIRERLRILLTLGLLRPATPAAPAHTEARNEPRNEARTKARTQSERDRNPE